MRSRTDLHLHEQILLLALRDRKGTPESGSGYARLAMGGAILAELALSGRISVDEGKWARVEAVSGADGPRDEILAEALALVRDRKRRQSAAEWLQSFSRLRSLQQRTALGLCQRGILRSTEARVLLVFKPQSVPDRRSGPGERARRTTPRYGYRRWRCGSGGGGRRLPGLCHRSARDQPGAQTGSRAHAAHKGHRRWPVPGSRGSSCRGEPAGGSYRRSSGAGGGDRRRGGYIGRRGRADDRGSAALAGAAVAFSASNIEDTLDWRVDSMP